MFLSQCQLHVVDVLGEAVGTQVGHGAGAGGCGCRANADRRRTVLTGHVTHSRWRLSSQLGQLSSLSATALALVGSDNLVGHLRSQ